MGGLSEHGICYQNSMQGYGFQSKTRSGVFGDPLAGHKRLSLLLQYVLTTNLKNFTN